MELRQLRYFLAVADAGSISEAARRLGVSQPTVSDRVHALEDRMQTNLFERQSRGDLPQSSGPVSVLVHDGSWRYDRRGRRSGSGWRNRPLHDLWGRWPITQR